jgi:hypothetical protein
MPAWIVAMLALIGAGPAAAQALPRDRISVPVPNAGDVTLVRALIATRVSDGARLGDFALRPRQDTVPEGVQVAAVGTIESPRPGRALADVVLAVARPATAGPSESDRITILLRGRGLRSTLINQGRQVNSRFFYAQNADCDHFAPPRRPDIATYLTRGPWSLEPARFARDAVSWGCPQAPGATEPAFATPMKGALGTGYVTWLADASGQITRLCVYVHDAAGASVAVLASDGRVTTASDPLVFPEEAVALVRLDVRSRRLDVQLRRAPGYVWGATIVADPEQPPPPDPPALAAVAGSCAG